MSVTLPTHVKADPFGFNEAAATYEVPVTIDPDLKFAGMTYTEPYGPPKRIVLREWDERVLLHEVLHCLLDGFELTHQAIATAEVGLRLAGYSRISTPPEEIS